MKLKVTVLLVIFFAGFVVVTAGVPNAFVTATMNTPTPTHNILLGTRSPEDVERGFPSPVPTLPPPTDLAPE
jgi:hypothetical protein